MAEIIEALGVSAFELIVTAFLGYVTWKMKKEDDKKDEREKEKKERDRLSVESERNTTELLLGVARVFLIDKMQKSLDRGFTTQAEYEVINDLYKPYVKCGGNGVVKHLFEDRYNNLKVKEHQ